MDFILAAHKVKQLIVDLRSVGQEERTARCKFGEKEKILVLTNKSVISFECFFLEFKVVSQLLFLRK